MYDECVSCLLGKMAKTIFIRHKERMNELLRIIISDAYEPMTMNSRHGESYFSRYDHVFC